VIDWGQPERACRGPHASGSGGRERTRSACRGRLKNKTTVHHRPQEDLPSHRPGELRLKPLGDDDVFEDQAAAELFRYLASKELCGTPPEPSAQQGYRQLIRGGPRLGRRLLPAGWSIVDDPTRPLPGLPGGFDHDREGVPAERVELVSDGYVRDLVMSRVPRHDLTLAGCMAHLRRKLRKAVEAHDPRATLALALVQGLYKVEELARLQALDAKGRRALRQERRVPGEPRQ
jgi:hypothetical protein